MSDREIAHLTHETQGSAVIVGIDGEVDAGNAAALGDEISDLLTNRNSGLVLDLSRTRYLDSAGIRMLLDLGERLRSRGQRLGFFLSRKQPLRLTLSLFEVQSAFPIADSLEEALARVEAAPGTG